MVAIHNLTSRCLNFIHWTYKMMISVWLLTSILHNQFCLWQPFVTASQGAFKPVNSPLLHSTSFYGPWIHHSDNKSIHPTYKMTPCSISLNSLNSINHLTNCFSFRLHANLFLFIVLICMLNLWLYIISSYERTIISNAKKWVITTAVTGLF